MPCGCFIQNVSIAENPHVAESSHRSFLQLSHVELKFAFQGFWTGELEPKVEDLRLILRRRTVSEYRTEVD